MDCTDVSGEAAGGAGGERSGDMGDARRRQGVGGAEPGGGLKGRMGQGEGSREAGSKQQEKVQAPTVMLLLPVKPR